VVSVLDDAVVGLVQMSENSIANAIFTLQCSTSNLEDQIRCLRYLKEAIKGCDNIILNTYHRQGLNQLIMDSVLKIVLNEDQSRSHQKRKLIRTELFLILADMLVSDNLFGGIREQIDGILSSELSEDSLKNGNE